MAISISSINVSPTHYPTGTHNCAIKYRGKGLNGNRTVTVTYILAGSSAIHFLVNGNKCKTFTENNVAFPKAGSTFSKIFQIIVTESNQTPQIAMLTVEGVDDQDYTDSDSKSITYD